MKRIWTVWKKCIT